MNFRDPGLRRFEDEIEQTANRFKLDRENLEVEFYSPRTQAILVERVECWRFRIHINLEEQRIIAVRQIENGVAAVGPEILARYKTFMK